MKDGWSETSFSSVLSSPVRNGIYKKKEFHGSGVKIVNMGELFANPRLGAIPMRRVNLSKSEQRRFSVQAGDLIFARRSLVAEGAGRCCVILETDELTAFESSIIRARPDPTISDSLFLYYYFNSPQGLHSLDTIRRQVAVAGITGTDLSQLPVPLPALPEQRAIANILGTLDDKIELNRRMNQTLEAMARAIFQDWFVDFGPVRAKIEGQDPYLPPELWDLFPDELVDSELGEIPEGWEVGNLGDVARSPTRSVSPAGVEEETPYIGLEHMPRHSIALSEWESADKVTSNKLAFQKGEFLFGKLRPYFHKVGTAPVDGICSTDMVVVRPIENSWSSFVLLCVSTDEFVGYTDQTSTGTRMPRTNWKTMSRYALCLPPEPIAQVFQGITEHLLDRILANIHQARSAASQRNALVPKLISGEVQLV